MPSEDRGTIFAVPRKATREDMPSPPRNGKSSIAKSRFLTITITVLTSALVAAGTWYPFWPLATNPKTANPKYWASFIVSGDPSPLHSAAAAANIRSPGVSK
jgi:hypothetical protein